MNRHQKQSKNMILTTLLLGCVVLSSLSYAMSDRPKPPTPEQQENIKKMEEEARYKAMPDCEGDDVVLSMDHARLKVHRSNQRVVLKNGSTIHGLKKPSPNYDCEALIENVATYSVAFFKVIDNPGEHLVGSYKSTFDFFEKHNAVLARSTNENGVERIQIVSVGSDTLKLPPEGAGSEYFILPKEVAPTYTGDPVVYTCAIVRDRPYQGIASCKTSYYHPSGLYVSLRIPRQPNTTNNLIEEDAKRRAALESLIIENTELNISGENP